MRRAAPPWLRPRLLPTILLLVAIVTVASGVKPDRRTWEEKKGERTIRRLTNAVTSDEPLHKTVCDGRPCRPGEGNLAGYEMWKQPYPPPDEATIQSLSKHVAHSAQGDHYAELAAVASARAKPAHFVALAVADFDYRLLALNWQASADRAGLGGSTVVYALDGPGFLFLRQALGPAMVVNGTAIAEAWEGTRLMRHIQRALAEKHMAAAALAASGLDVLLCDTSEIFLSDPRPALTAALRTTSADILTARSCGDKHLGCVPRWDLQLLRGGGGAGRRALVVGFVEAAAERGMIDFYMRWWAGTHCILVGFQKLFSDSSPSLEGGLTPAANQASPNATAVLRLTASKWCLPTDCLRVALLPLNAFPLPNRFLDDRDSALMGRVDKPPPTPTHRLRLDRYDEADMGGLQSRMKEAGIWFLT